MIDNESLFEFTAAPKINCIIVDDDPIASLLLRSLVKKTKFLHLEEICSTPTEASVLLHKQFVNIVFLDIEMPEMNGLEFIETFHVRPAIIFTSAKKDYVEDAFDKGVVDYLIKPVNSYSRFLKAVNKAVKRLQKQQKLPSQKPHLFIKVDSLLQHFNLSDILWIEAYGDFIKIYTSKTTYTVSGTLKTMLDKLPAQDFVQVHRSYIVRIDKVQNINSTNLQVNKKILPVSKSFKRHLLNRITTL